MENTKYSIKKTIIGFGVILGILNAFKIYLSFLIDSRTGTNWVLSTIGLLVFITIVSLGIKTYKSKNNNFLKLRQALKIGAGIALIGFTFSTLSDIVMLKVIFPEVLDKIVNLNYPLSINKTIEQNRILSLENKVLVTISTIAIFGNTILGVLIAFVAGAIMRKKKLPIY